jgi:GTP-binding protein
VGRPNVGKSSLFNWLAGRRIAIVDPTAGVTRDRVSTTIEADGRVLELIDTGGMGVEDVDDLTEQIERQIDLAMAQSDLLLFVVDGRAGVAPLDLDVAERLRRVGKPVVLAANKCDSADWDAQTAEFYKLGQGRPVCVSALQNRNRPALLARILAELPPPSDETTPPEPALKLAVVGRRNTGKSTFINCLAEDERVIVSEVPGTTRDSIDVRFECDGKTIIAIDTAGVRRKRSVSGDLEFYSLHRAERSIRRSDVTLLFFDARVKVSKTDKQLAEYILELHKPAIFVVNKWDLLKPMPTGRMADYLRQTFPSLDYVPIAFITAKEGRNVHALVNLAQSLHKQASRRFGTGDLNRVLRHALEAAPPPQRQNRRAKIYYATQAAVNPPTFVLFTNGPQLLDNTYHRYLVKTFRDQLGFNDVPIKLILRARRREDEEVEDVETPPQKPRRPRRKRGDKADGAGLWTDV